MSRRHALVPLAALAVLAPGPTAAAALPRVVIDAPRAIPDEPKVTARMKVGGRRGYVGRVGIEIRGSSSQLFPKKAYGLETRTRRGENRPVSLLGMPKESDWVLLASYDDKTLMRNAVGYRAARRLGRYASRLHHVELVLNGRYQGVYLLGEQLKLDGGRVDVDDRGVSGGYLLEMKSRNKIDPDDRVFRAPVTRTAIAYADPEREDLSARRAAWIRRYVGRFERALHGRDFRDRRRGYRAYLDVPAAVDYVLLNEYLKNHDAFQASAYMHKSTGGKLLLGPMWDLDLSMGNSNFPQSNGPTGSLLADYRWTRRLYRDPAFVRSMARRWRVLRREGLLGDLLRDVDRTAVSLRGAQARNFRRWDILGTNIFHNAADPRTGALPATYAQEVSYLKWFLCERAAWMDRNVTRLARR